MTFHIFVNGGFHIYLNTYFYVFTYVFHPKVNTVNDTNKPTCLDPPMVGRTKAVEMCTINYRFNSHST